MLSALRSFTRLGDRSLVAVVIALSTSLSVLWAVTVPIYQSPDEDLHADYVFALADHGGLLTVRDRPVSTDPLLDRTTNPVAASLGRAAGFDSVVFRTDVRAPQDYGSPGFWDAVDARAPWRQRAVHSPYLLPYYPFGYYAVDALAVAGVRALGGGAHAAFLAARLVSSALLALSLLLVYALAREWGLGARRSVLVTLAVGIAPLTSFLSSYVQPDNLSLLLTTAALLLALRWQRSPTPPRLLGLAACAGALAVTKPQFGACAALMAAATVVVVTRWRPRRLAGRLAVLAAPGAAFAAVHLWVVAGWRAPLVSSQASDLHWNTQALQAAAGHGATALARYLLHSLRGGLTDYFFGGTSFRSYWGIFGWLDTPISFGPSWLTGAVFAILEAGTAVVGALLLWSALARLWPVLGLIRTPGRRGAAVERVLGDPVAVLYVAFAGFMLALFLVIGDSFNAQGRNWFPVMPAAVILASGVPRLPWRHPRIAGDTILAGLVLYSLAGSVAAYTAVHWRYYGDGREVHRVAVESLPGPAEGAAPAHRVIRFETPFPSGRALPLDHVRPGGTLAVAGWSDQAGAVFVALDGRVTGQAHLGEPSTAGRAGFDAVVQTAGLAPGRHELRLLVASPDRTRLAWLPERFEFVTEPA